VSGSSGARNCLIHLVFIVLCFLAQPLWAATADSPVRAEINRLLDRLQASGCQFNRNGTWHTAAEAKAHLLGKLDGLERRAALSSAEQFIDLAASKSSMSGKPYQVMCGNAAAVESKIWLMKELQAVRAAIRATVTGAYFRSSAVYHHA
jgi:hypothetical protein